ncbi:unnamed protein product [Choristocarpus tenellus]
MLQPSLLYLPTESSLSSFLGVCVCVNVSFFMLLFFVLYTKADANELRLTPAYLNVLRQRALYQNLKTYFGNRMPEYIVDKSRGREGARMKAVGGAGVTAAKKLIRDQVLGLS